MARIARRVFGLSVAATALVIASFLLTRDEHTPFLRVKTAAHCDDPECRVNASESHTQSHLAPRREHTLHPNGLLETNLEGAHPIFDLIEGARKRWKEKSERQSRTLVEAVNEYQRRYGRMPPKGFDKWWDYVVKHDVRLPDEYDQINRDLEPFYGMDPFTLIAEQQKSEGSPFTFTLVNSALGELSVEGMNVNSPGDKKKPDAQLKFLREVAKDIPSFRATFSSQDGSSKNMYWHLKKNLVDAARAGSYFDPLGAPDPKTFGFHWDVICPPESPMISYLAEPSSPDTTRKSFIHDHLASMDPCYHPHHSYQIGFLHARREGPLRFPPPIFAYSKSTIHTEILGIPADQLFLDVGDDPVWEEKEDERAFWRGSNTGLRFRYEDVELGDGGPVEGEKMRWKESQRVRLVDLCSRRKGVASVLAPPPGSNHSIGNQNIRLTDIPYGRLNPSFVDVAFTGQPVQCDPKMCEFLKGRYEFRQRISQSDANQYKYFIDIDGNGWSGRFRKLMSTNSLVLKATIFPEWFTDRIQPWVHYVPLQVDYSDLYDILTFFRGDLAGVNAHNDLAKEIALTGKDWVKTHWRIEDITAYMFRLMLEYARVMSVDRNAATFQFEHSTEEESS